jgi:hypothetical protein
MRDASQAVRNARCSYLHARVPANADENERIPLSGRD